MKINTRRSTADTKMRAAIMRWRDEGKSFGWIGKELNISRQRAFQQYVKAVATGGHRTATTHPTLHFKREADGMRKAAEVKIPPKPDSPNRGKTSAYGPGYEDRAKANAKPE